MSNALLSVKDVEGNVYTMPSKGPRCILEVHYSTSYIQFVIQDVVEQDGATLYPTKDVCVPLPGGNWVDMIAVKPEEVGEIIEGGEVL